jgi:hypothetical protein
VARATAEELAREVVESARTREPSIPSDVRVVAGEHAKRKRPIWTVTVGRRFVGKREQFTKAKREAESRDGEYSSLHRGFLFRNEQEAYDFVSWLDRQKAEEEANEESQEPSIPSDVRVVAGEHAKRKHPIWTVTTGRRFAGEQFQTAKRRAEAVGGYYSSFRGGGAVPGFVFRDEQQAGAFAAWLAAEKSGRAEGASEPRASGPFLRAAKTSTGQISAAALDRGDLYFQRYREQADKVLSYLPVGFTTERHESKHGQIYVFLDSADRLLTRGDYARLGAAQKEEVETSAASAEVERRQAEERRTEEETAKSKLEAARRWNVGGRKVYELTSQEYQSAMGVDRPYIGEISGLQYSRMSERSKRAYDRKRRGEWARSARVGSGWRSMVETLALAGDIDLSTPGLSSEAGSVVARIGELREEEAKEKRRIEFMRRLQVAEATATRLPERAVRAEERARKIRNLVSRGVKRETGALSINQGFVRYAGDRGANVTVKNRNWEINSPAMNRLKPYAVGTFTDEDTAESVAEAIFAALRATFGEAT